MPTPSQIEEQIQLEREQIKQGLDKLHKNVRELEAKEYASASVYGAASIDTLLPLVVRYIEDTTHNRLKRGVGFQFQTIKQYVSQLEPLGSAAIALKITFDKVFSYKDKSNMVANVCDAIGKGVEDECQMRHYETNAPGLLNVLKKNYWHKSIGTHQKLVVIRTLMNRYDVKQWEPWGRANRIKLGTWLLDCIMQSSGWFDKDIRREGRKTVQYIIPTPEFLKIKDKVMRDAELFAPLAWPMLIPPNDWTNDTAGGYLLNEVMRGHKMVRRVHDTRIQGETPIKFLNKIQQVAYRLNPFTVGVAEELDRLERAVGKFLPIHNHELPPKPFDIADNKDARKTYRREAAEVMNLNAQEFRKSCRTRMTMEAVQRFKNRERFFIPWSFDYRGRAYPIPAFLTPQDTDFGKSLLRFADESFMTPEAEQWLAFQVATTYGLDKAPMLERLEWVAKNTTLITNVATDPINYLPEWEVADEPWQFLAACDEYYHCVIACDRQHTGLAVATDATCSGLQILAGLARDANTARLVNVLPSDRPQDAYKVVSETATPHCPESIQPYMDRKVVKRVVMTVPYNAKPFSNRGYIRDALKEKNVEISKEDLTKTVKAVRDAMDLVVPGPMAVMKWIEQQVDIAISEGKTELEWVTPSGFVVHQRLMKKKIETLNLQLLGRCKMTVATDESNEVDKNHHKNATAPNLIHSLDASLLHLSVLRFNAPISLIHDSVLCRATDMSTLSTFVRETYMHLFAEHDYLIDWALQIGAPVPPPIIGDLKPESVIESTYFFC
ncbi:DNA-directed RNA polymerase [Synechococcus phage S-B28]|uniref:DNA-directed RNA polymerase n=1 Tax=Synechococcus phage S-B28 TaxID=2545435 RepID=A0A482IEF7_9CAUD|nr:RNA polymerase [Synechococcus phage S-B28]QBP05838.1 DNA-directed RNA polymerase [Synechococcus phage S-B28]